MITKETARDIYNCYQQLEEIAKLKKEMLEEIERIRKRYEEEKEPIPDNGGTFGRYGKGMQLGVPDSNGYSSMRIFSISPNLGLMVMDEQKCKLECRMRELETIAKLEMSRNINSENQ